MDIRHFYDSEILTRLIREGFEITTHYELAKRGLGVITIEEAEDDYVFWKDRLGAFYERLGWNPKLVEILNNN
ncbi:MAG: hypothetical protein KKD94_06390 [Nanoarchaeota archaeon]|nr:hypothetical protein [Nanoarchaeota archaeon]